MKYVVLYESADDVASKAPPHFPAHKARLDEFHARGSLLMVGTFAASSGAHASASAAVGCAFREAPQTPGSMAIFTSREAAEEFVAGDPFVRNGVVRTWEIREWNEVLQP